MVVVLIVVGTAIAVAFGYLPARMAARKGYSLPIFWICGTIALLPTAIVAGVLRDRRA